MKRFFTWLGLYDHSGRRAWAFLSMLLGCGVMTTFAALSLYLVRAELVYVFWLGMAAHMQVVVALTGFTAMFIKRDVEISQSKVVIKDRPDGTTESSVDVQHTDK